MLQIEVDSRIGLHQEQDEKQTVIQAMDGRQYLARCGLEIEIQAGGDADQQQGKKGYGNVFVTVQVNRFLPYEVRDNRAANHAAEQHEKRNRPHRSMLSAPEPDPPLAEMKAAGPLQTEKGAIADEQDAEALKKWVDTEQDGFHNLSSRRRPAVQPPFFSSSAPAIDFSVNM